MCSKTKVVLTGTNGFVGSHLAEFLNTNEFEVHGIVRNTSNTDWIDHIDIKLHKCGLTNVEKLVDVFEGAEYIFHLAGTTNAKTYSGYQFGNVTLAKNVLDACLQLKQPPKRLVLTSSIAASSPSTKNNPIDEDFPSNPVSSYGKSKVEMENLAKTYFDKLPITIIRPPIIYGERDTEVYQFFKAIKTGIFPKVGRNEKYVDVVYVKDLVKGYLQAAQSERALGQTYFLTADEVVTWSQLAKLSATHLNKKTITLTLPHGILYIAGYISGFFNNFKKRPSVFDIEKAREGVQEAWIFSCEKAKQHFNYKPSVKIEEGITQTLNWYEKERWL